MDLAIVIGIIITAIGSFATAAEAWLSWKKHRLEESERLRQFAPPPPRLVAGEVTLISEVGADYTKLRDLLVARKFKEADEETRQKMLYVARREKEGCLYPQDIKNFPCLDLRTSDQLWVQNSNGHFGFSVQKEIYRQPYNNNIHSFSRSVEWLAKGKWKNYNNFIFEMRAARGHLPSHRFFTIPGNRNLVYMWFGVDWKERGIVGNLACLISRVETCKM